MTPTFYKVTGDVSIGLLGRVEFNSNYFGFSLNIEFPFLLSFSFRVVGVL